jgi:GNAT superfamily N-acetyltransferase
VPTRPTAIRPARPDEAPAISALALRSKGHWPYTPEQMAVFARELTLSPADVAARLTHVLETDGQLAGFYTLLPRPPGEAELEHLFVEPSRLGRGLGSALFRHACSLGRAAGFARLLILSDPNAAGFYAGLGARLVREVPSSIPGRKLPLYSVDLGH